MIVSYSEVAKYQKCPRQFYYGILKGHRQIEMSDAISVGVFGHTLLQRYFGCIKAGMSHVSSVAAMNDKAKELNKTLDFRLLTAWTLVTEYLKKLDFKATALFVENRFLVPASNLTDDPYFKDIEIGLTPDLVIQRTGDFLDVEDFKFTQREWDTTSKQRASQVKIYQLCLESMGYKVTRSRFRFFNTKTGVLSDYSSTMNSLERIHVKQDFLEGVRLVVEAKKLFEAKGEDTYYPRTLNFLECRYCPFKFPCELEFNGKDASNTFKTQYTKRTYDYSK